MIFGKGNEELFEHKGCGPEGGNDVCMGHCPWCEPYVMGCCYPIDATWVDLGEVAFGIEKDREIRVWCSACGNIQEWRDLLKWG